MEQFLAHKNTNLTRPIAEPRSVRHEVMRHHDPARHSHSPGIEISLDDLLDQGVSHWRRVGLTHAEGGSYTDLFGALVGCEFALNLNALTSVKPPTEYRFRRKDHDCCIVVLEIAQTSSLTHGNGSRGQNAFGGYIPT